MKNNTSPTPRTTKNWAEVYSEEPGTKWEQTLAIAGCTGHNIERLKPRNTTPALEGAMGYAIFRHWKVFPARMEDGKKWSYLSGDYAPGGKNWGMTDDPEQLRRNFVNPKWRLLCGVGVPTGWVNGIFVVEADTPAGHDVDGLASLRELEAKHGLLPNTLMAQSPSGSIHRYFKHPGRGIKIGDPKGEDKKIAPGVDVKGDGGMVVAPPSVAPASMRVPGVYCWLNKAPIADAPQWLIDLVTTDASSNKDVVNDAAANSFEQYGDEVRGKIPLDKLTFMLMKVIPNTVEKGRAHWIKVGHALKHERPGDDGRQLFLQFSLKWDGALDEKYVNNPQRYEKSVAETWRGMEPSRITGGSIYWLADEADPDWRGKYEAERVAASNAVKHVVIVRAADVKMRRMEWLWEGHLLRKGLELTTGLPGLGKSQAQIHFMACASAGLPWPDGAPAIVPVNVIMVTAEDAIDTQVVPRLVAAGADLNRVHILQYIRTDKLKRQFLLAEDLAKLEQAIAQIDNVGLVCIDPITAYMGGKMDSHKATEVRAQLGPLKDFAERTNVAVSAITHPAKNASGRAIDHFIGSQAFIAAARVGHACFEEVEVDEDTGEKTPTGRILFTNVKYSAHRKMPTLAYKIESAIINPEPFVQIETSRVVWEKEAVDVSAEQAIAAAKSSGKGEKKEEAASSELMDLLRYMIDASDDGWCMQAEFAAQAKALGYSDKEQRTARKHLGIVSKKQGFDGRWMLGWQGKRPLRF